MVSIVPIGAEFRINSTITSEQSYPAVTTLSDGSFVVTWMSNGQDGSGYGIYGQRYTSSGGTVFSEFRINTYAINQQLYPAVTALSDGGFVVTWMSLFQDGSIYGIYGQRYNSSGGTVGSEFRINTTTSGDQQYPAVTALSDGSFVVTWMSFGQDGSSNGVYGQRYNSSGGTAGGEFHISTATAGNQMYPAVAALSDGGFVVTWMSDAQDGSLYGVYGQRYDSSGGTVGSEFRINATTANDQSYPAVTALSDGGFVVTWMSQQDGSGYGIYGQRYDSSGGTVGSEFRINTTTALDQSSPALTALSDGGFVVTWMSYLQDGSGHGIYGQRYDSSGVTVGSEFRINATTANEQSYPALTALSDGGFVVTWTSYGQDGFGNGVYGQRYTVGNATPTGSVTISGTPVKGATLHASHSITDADGLGTITYTWQRDGLDLVNTSPDFVIGPDDVGRRISVVARYVDQAGNAEQVTSDPTPLISGANAAPGTQAKEVTLSAGATYVFSTSDFAFTDANPGDALQYVLIKSLPTTGTLQRDGVTLTAETLPTLGTIPVADIAAGKLAFLTAPGQTVPATLQFAVSDGIDAGEQDLRAGTLGAWSFSNGGADLTGNGHTLVPAGGASFATGLGGQGLTVDGSPGSFASEAANGTAFDLGNKNFAIEVWAKFDNTNGEQVLIEKLTGMGDAGWTFTKLADDSLRFYGTAFTLTSSALAIAPDTWHQFVATRTGDTLSIYMDGALVGEGTGPAGYNYNASTNPLLVGARNAGDGRDFTVDGTLDDVLIYDHGLAASQVEYFWNAGAGKPLQGLAESSPATITLTLPLTLTGDVAKSVTEAAEASGGGVSVVEGTLIAAAGGNPVNFVNTVTAGAFGEFSIAQDGTWTYTLDNANQTVSALNVGSTPLTETFTVQTVVGLSQDVTITINGADDPTVLSAPENFFQQETNQPLIFTGKLNAIDPDTSVTFVSANDMGGVPGTTINTNNGTFTIQPDGTWTYTTFDALDVLAAGETRNDRVFVKTSNGLQTEVQLNYIGTNDAPTTPATNTLTTQEDTASSAVAIGAADVDGPGLTFSLTGAAPAKGTVSFDQAAGTFVYTPNADANGTDSFTVAISDGTAPAVQQTVSVFITPAPDAPVGVADVVDATEAGGVLNGTAGVNPSGNVLTNDTDADAGDKAGLTVSAFQAPPGARGTLTLNTDGSYTYEVNQTDTAVQALRTYADTLTDVYTYTVRDAAGLTSQATLSVVVHGANDAPVGGADTGTITENQTASFNVLANDTDVDAGDSRTLTSFGPATVSSSNTAVNGLDVTAAVSILNGQIRFVAGNLLDKLAGTDTATVTIPYTLTDLAGATATSTLTLTVNGAYDKPVITGITPDTGTSATDEITSATSFSVRGTSDSNVAIKLYEGANVVGTATADATGAWSVQLSGVTSGAHPYVAKLAVNETLASTAAAVTVDTTGPVTNFASATLNSDSGASGDGLTNDGKVTFAGTVSDPLATTVALYNGGTVNLDGTLALGTKLGNATVAAGAWNFAPTLAAGNYSVVAVATDAAGNQTLVASPGPTLKIDKTGPTLSTLSQILTQDTGSSSTDRITSDGAVTVSATVTDTNGVSKVEVLDGTNVIGQATAAGDTWTYATVLGLGSHQLSLRATDNAGNITTSAAFGAITVEASAPIATFDTQALTADTGVSATDGKTNNGQVTFGGTVTDSLTTTVALYNGSTANPDGTLTLGTKLGNATVAAGAWTYATTLAAGSFDVVAVVTDAAGNKTLLDAPGPVLVVDKTLPTVTIAQGLIQDTGNTNDRVSSVGGVSLTGTVADTGGSGIAGVAVWDAATNTKLGDATISAGTWSLSQTLSEGSHQLFAIATDVAGNTKSTTNLPAIVIDSVGPSVAVTSQTLTADTGTSNTDLITSNGLVSLAGTYGDNRAGSIVEIWDQSTATKLGNATLNANSGTWTYSTTLAAGPHQLYARAVDVAGNDAPTGARPSIVVDKAAPAPTLTDLLPTGVGTFTLSGLTEAASAANGGSASSVTIKDGAAIVGALTANFDGTWSTTVSLSTNVAHTITLTSTDAAGNVGTGVPKAFIGTSGVNSFTGTAGNDLFFGGGGNDAFTGGAGKDTFVFTPGFGKDVVNGFVHLEDVLTFSSSIFGSAADVLARATQAGADTVIDPTGTGVDTITLKNIAALSLTSQDFHILV